MELKAGEKYCPIDTHPWEIDSMCKKEKCAWWNGRDKNCCIEVACGIIYGFLDEFLAAVSAFAKWRNR